MAHFRKKAVVIEAVRAVSVLVAAKTLEWGDLPEWLREAYARDEWTLGGGLIDSFITIRTLEGEMRANADDWIIRGVQGELYPCKPDIFAATYDPAGPSALGDIAAERNRQVQIGRTEKQDDRYDRHQLVLAAVAYALAGAGWATTAAFEMWPKTWGQSWFKPSSPRRNLIKAGALIAAEIERLDRRAGDGAT